MKKVFYAFLFHTFFCFSMNQEALSTPELLQRGKDLLNRKQLKESCSYFDTAYKRNSSEALVYLVLVHKKLMNHYYERAIDIGDMAIAQRSELYGQKRNDYYNKFLQIAAIEEIELLAQLDSTITAKDIYNAWKNIQASQARNGCIDSCLKLGLYYMMVDNNDEAEKLFLTASKTHPLAAHNLSVLYASQNKRAQAAKWEKIAEQLGYDSASSSS